MMDKKSLYMKAIVFIWMFASSSVVSYAQRNISGIISDEKGLPIAAADVFVKDGNIATQTDEDGRFTIQVSDSNVVLLISYGGGEIIQKVVNDSENNIVITYDLSIYGQKIDKGIKVFKPAIYLYPENKEEVAIINNFKGKILNTYPAYNGKWNVVAEPNGILWNKADNRKYNYLFWDGIAEKPFDLNQLKSGFYVDRKNIVTFLQEKLAHIGLNETEINDFITYWLPVLNEHETNFIYFDVNNNLNNTSTLSVTPPPETMIRVLMEYYPIDKDEKNKLPEQQLPSIQRKGFTLVEWGGCRIGKIDSIR